MELRSRRGPFGSKTIEYDLTFGILADKKSCMRHTSFSLQEEPLSASA